MATQPLYAACTSMAAYTDLDRSHASAIHTAPQKRGTALTRVWSDMNTGELTQTLKAIHTKSAASGRAGLGASPRSNMCRPTF